MKLLIYTISGVVLFAPSVADAIIPGGVVVQLCLTSSECNARINCDAADKCCCPTGNTRIVCPNGWTWDSEDELCKRASTNSSDTYGYFTISYGTCGIESTTTEDCYDAPVSKSSIETGVIYKCNCPCTNYGI